MKPRRTLRGIAASSGRRASASALNHPNIVTIHEIGEDDGTTFIAMELVDGTPLDRLLAQGPPAIATALDYAVQIASALAAAHASGIVHRDIKPANIVITRDGRAKVLDFGLAKLIELAADQATITAVATEPGLSWARPPTCLPNRPKAAGRCAVRHLLVRRRPLRNAGGTAAVHWLHACRCHHVDPARSAGARAEHTARRAGRRRRDHPARLAKDPAARYPDAAAMRAELDTAHAKLTRAPESIWRRPQVLVPVALLLLAVAGFGIWQTVQVRRVRWVREAIPEIERLQTARHNVAALRKARETERYASAEIQIVRQAWYPLRLVTDPQGANVEIKDYLDVNGPWEPIGQTPLRDVPAARLLSRAHQKPGYAPMEFDHRPPRSRD